MSAPNSCEGGGATDIQAFCGDASLNNFKYHEKRSGSATQLPDRKLVKPDVMVGAFRRVPLREPAQAVQPRSFFRYANCRHTPKVPLQDPRMSLGPKSLARTLRFGE